MKFSIAVLLLIAASFCTEALANPQVTVQGTTTSSNGGFISRIISTITQKINTGLQAIMSFVPGFRSTSSSTTTQATTTAATQSTTAATQSTTTATQSTTAATQSTTAATQSTTAAAQSTTSGAAQSSPTAAPSTRAAENPAATLGQLLSLFG
nr:cell wall integrity and stress response component 2-like [Halyomorpha halys]